MAGQTKRKVATTDMLGLVRRDGNMNQHVSTQNQSENVSEHAWSGGHHKATEAEDEKKSRCWCCVGSVIKVWLVQRATAGSAVGPGQRPLACSCCNIVAKPSSYNTKSI